MGKILIGWAEESIIPKKKASLAGQFFERISQFVESDITATAMAVEADGSQMIMVSVDIVGINDYQLSAIREKFASLTSEVDPRNLIVSATHSHTSLILAGRKGVNNTKDVLSDYLPKNVKYEESAKVDDSVSTPEESLELVATKVALAAKKAWDNRKESLYANEFGRAAVGMCRRATYLDGSAKMWGDTNTGDFVALEGGNDSGVELIFTFDTNKKLTGIVANIACPAQILEQRSFISADFWGRTKANLRAKFGNDIFLLALCGAGGDQCPRDLVRWVNPETPIDDPNVERNNYFPKKADPSMYDISGCNRVGKRVANEIISVYEEITDIKSEAPFVHKVIDLDVPLRKVTQKDYDDAIRELEYYSNKIKDKESFNFKDTAKMYIYAGTLERYAQQQNQEVVPIEYHIIRLGDVAFATNPYELYLDYGNRIKARSKAQQTFIVQLCCGSHGYLPTEKAEIAGHYSAYVSGGDTGHEGGDLLTRETITHINKLFE